MKALASAPADERPQLGKQANELKQDIEAALTAKLDARRVGTRRPPAPWTSRCPAAGPSLGHRHPLTHLRERIEDIFARLGYEILEGPETEDDYHNFEALNMPPDHPARDMQDTLYLAIAVVPVGAVRRDCDRRQRAVEAQVRAATLLRTHTSAMQIRYMQPHQPPVRIIAPGRVYRRDNLDLTHTPMFQQFEGLVVGEGVTMGDLKGTLIGVRCASCSAPRRRCVFRPSFFPYTEPSAEVFIGCRHVRRRRLRDVQADRLDRVLGCGMVHPAVFEAVGLRPGAVHRLRLRRRHRARSRC